MSERKRTRAREERESYPNSKCGKKNWKRKRKKKEKKKEKKHQQCAMTGKYVSAWGFEWHGR